MLPYLNSCWMNLDHAVVRHGYTDYMRAYEVIVYATGSPYRHAVMGSSCRPPPTAGRTCG